MPRQERTTYNQGTHTRCLVAFYTFADNGFSSEEPISSHPELGDVIGVSTSKKLGAASGTFTITIKKPSSFGPVSALRRLWKDPEGVWVKIVMEVDGQRFDLMLGNIDSAQESDMRTGQGAQDETYTITGRDFGKVFETTELFVNIHGSPQRAVLSLANLNETALQSYEGTPEKFIRLLIHTWVANQERAEQQWALPPGLGGGFFSNILSLRQIQEMNTATNGFTAAPTLFTLDQTGKLWDIMQEYANGGLNELFVDLGPDGRFRGFDKLKPVVYFRERPFPTFDSATGVTDRSSWDRLRTRVLEPSDIKDHKVAKGGSANRFNYWTLTLKGVGNDAFNVSALLQAGLPGVVPGRPGDMPIFNEQSIQRHGLRRHDLTSKYLPFREARNVLANPESTTDSEFDFLRLASNWLKKVHDWFSIAPRELSGQLVTSRAMPEIRIGERIQEKRAEGNITYYCEGVDTGWSYPNAGTTTLTVTRGEYEDEHLLEDLYATYESPAALTAREMCFIPEDASPNEIEDLFAEGCSFIVPETPRALLLLEGRRGEGFIGEDDGFTVSGGETAQRSLGSDLDSSLYSDPTERSAPDAGMLPIIESFSDSAPTVVTAEPGTVILSQRSLERGEPIEGLDLSENFDPLAGLGEDEGF